MDEIRVWISMVHIEIKLVRMTLILNVKVQISINQVSNSRKSWTDEAQMHLVSVVKSLKKILIMMAQESA